VSGNQREEVCVKYLHYCADCEKVFKPKKGKEWVCPACGAEQVFIYRLFHCKGCDLTAHQDSFFSLELPNEEHPGLPETCPKCYSEGTVEEVQAKPGDVQRFDVEKGPRVLEDEYDDDQL